MDPANLFTSLYAISWPFFISVVSFLIAIVIIVFVHEYGHYIAARLCGIKSTIFSIGFGPELYGVTDKHGTRWRIAAVPLGGYVLFDGESLIEASSKEVKKFDDNPLWARVVTVVSGPLFNFIFAILLLTAVFCLSGVTIIRPIVAGVLPDSPAQIAGIMVDDRITSIDNIPVNSFYDVANIVSKLPEHLDVVQIIVDRKGDSKTLMVSLSDQTKSIGIFASPHNVETASVSMQEAFLYSLLRVKYAIISSFDAIKRMILGVGGLEQMQGVVGIASMLGQAVDVGIFSYITMVAVLSASLGFVNLIPIPALDGGHLAFYFFEFVLRGRFLPSQLKIALSWSGMAFLLILMVVVTFYDVGRLLSAL